MLMLGHPGHELRLHGWLERNHPTVHILTDGSGANRSPRIEATLRLLDRSGCRKGSIFGRFTDRELYDLILRGECEPVAEVVLDLAADLVRKSVELVIADAFELYNPAHDLASLIARLAAERATNDRGRFVAVYHYAVVGDPSLTTPGAMVLALDDDAVARKMRSAEAYGELQSEIVDALARYSPAAFQTEVLWPASGPLLPADPSGVPYEQHGADRVRAGVYQRVLRYQNEFVPFASRLIELVGSAVGARPACH
ncbi:MAG TPA: hypothetical protein VEZ11_18355 [Thermoanaerobaculia bacterium]|nr:hypothetical protein [Thermoanaerobaculia bacterium]